MKKNDTVEAEKILKVTSEELFDFKRNLDGLKILAKKMKILKRKSLKLKKSFQGE